MKSARSREKADSSDDERQLLKHRSVGVDQSEINRVELGKKNTTKKQNDDVACCFVQNLQMGLIALASSITLIFILSGVAIYQTSELKLLKNLSVMDSLPANISTSTSPVLYGSDNGVPLYNSTKTGAYVSLCASCYYRPFSTVYGLSEATIDHPCITYGNCSFYGIRGPEVTERMNKYGDRWTNSWEPSTKVFAVAFHHAERIYSPREKINQIDIELIGPRNSNFTLILSTNYHYSSKESLQQFFIRVYKDVTVREIIIHGNDSIPDYKIVAKEWSDSKYVSKIPIYTRSNLASDAYYNPNTLIKKLSVEFPHVSNYTYYMMCVTSRLFELREGGECSSEMKEFAIYFLWITYTVCGSCLVLSLLGMASFFIASFCACKRQFEAPQRLA